VALLNLLWVSGRAKCFRLRDPESEFPGYVPLTLQRRSRGGIIKDVEEMLLPNGRAVTGG
jgi:hypothetical protein